MEDRRLLVGELLALELDISQGGTSLLRDFNGDVATREVTFDVGENFDLEVLFDDLQFSPLGAFSVYVDILASNHDVIRPVLSETQILEFSRSLADATGGTFELSVPGRGSVDIGLLEFAFEQEELLTTALESDLGFGAGNISVTADLREPDAPFRYTVRFLGDAEEGADIPNISIDNTNLIGADVTSSVLEIPPFIGGDPTQVNPVAIPFNIDTRSRSAENVSVFQNVLQGTFDPAGTVLFDNLGATGPVAAGGLPGFLGSGFSPLDFEAFSLELEVIAPVTDLELTVQPSDEIALYGIDEALAPDLILLNANASVTVNASDQPKDLVQFANDLIDANTVLFGARNSELITEQLKIFEDGARALQFVEITNPDGTLNDAGIALGIDPAFSHFPIWEFDGDFVDGPLSLTEIATFSGISIARGDTPTFSPIAPQSVALGSPLHLPIDGYDPDGQPLTVSVFSSDPDLLEPTVIEGNRSLRLSSDRYGDQVFELFEQRVPRPAGRVAELAESGFYDGLTYHRVLNDFIVQAGDPLGNGSGGSTLGTFDDQYHVDIQHNRSGVLSFAKTVDDTNDSQIFIVEGSDSARHLDFQFSAFGQLVEGETTREAISNVPADPVTGVLDPTYTDQFGAVTIDEATVFEDNENSVVMLKGLGDTPGQTSIIVSISDIDGNTFSQVVNVDVVADESRFANGTPFLNEIDAVEGVQDAPFTIQLTSQDVEGDVVLYGGFNPFSPSDPDFVDYGLFVDQTTGVVTVTPPVGYIGELQVGTFVYAATGGTIEDGVSNAGTVLSQSSSLDTQVVSATLIEATNDYGDAPDISTGASSGDYQTTEADDGPRHQVDVSATTLFLGSVVDADSGILQNASATADDISGTTNDEDGIVEIADLVGTIGFDSTITLQATNETGIEAMLYGWIDLDQDGVFDNATERSEISIPDGSVGENFELTFPIRVDVAGGTTYARFRLSTDETAANPTGPASDGEVEDHVFTIGAPLLVEVQVSDDTLAIGESATATFTFSEEPFGFDLDDITAPNGVLTDLIATDEPTVFTAVLSPADSVEDITNQITVTGFTNAAGNIGVTRASANYVVDTIAPVVTPPSNTTVEGDTTGGASKTGTILTELLAAATVEGASMVDDDAPDLFPLGETVVTFSSTDEAGNVATATTTVVVTDTTAPTIDLPASINLVADVNGGASASLLDGSASANDIVDESPTISTDAEGVLPPGETVVTFTATDDAGNATTQTTTVTVEAVDLQLAISETPEPAVAGEAFVLGFSVSNVGSLAATKPVLTGDLPENTSLIESSSSSDCSVEGSVLTCSFDSVDPGQTIQRFVSVAVPANAADDSSLTHQYEVTAAEVDGNVSGNQVDVATEVIRNTDLEVSTVVGTSAPREGGNLVLSTTIRNNGPSDASGVVVTQSLPEGSGFDASGSSDACALIGSEVVCMIDELEAGSQTRFKITVSEIPLGTFTTSTTVAGEETEIDSTNNSVTRSVIGRPSFPGNSLTEDSLVAEQDTPLPIRTGVLIENDEVSSISDFGQPSNGRTTATAGLRSVIYTPDPGYIGPDSFVYSSQVLPPGLTLEITDDNSVRSQALVEAASWSINKDVPSDFQFSLDLSEASVPITSALTSGEVIPKIALIEVIGFGLLGRPSEHARWTLHDVTFESISSSSLEDDDATRELFSASFKKIELDAAQLPTNQRPSPTTPSTPRYHAGFDFESEREFSSEQFFEFSRRNIETLNVDEVGSGLYAEIDNLGVLEIPAFSFDVLGPAQTETGKDGTRTATLTLPGSDLVSGSVLLDSLFNEKSIGEVTITKLFKSNQDVLRLDEWTLSGVKVENYASDIIGEGFSGQTLAIRFDEMKFKSEQRSEGKFDREVTLDAATNTVSGKKDFGEQSFFNPNGLSVSRVLLTPSGAIPIHTFGFSARALSVSEYTFTADSGEWTAGLLAASADETVVPAMDILVKRGLASGADAELYRSVLTNAVVTSVSLESAESGPDQLIFTVAFEAISQSIDTERELRAKQLNAQDAASEEVVFDSSETNVKKQRSIVSSVENSQLQRVDLVDFGSRAIEIAEVTFGIGENQTPNEFNIVSKIGKHSSGLMSAALSQEVFPEIKILQREISADGVFTPVTWTLERGFVSNYSLSFGEDSEVFETFSISLIDETAPSPLLDSFEPSNFEVEIQGLDSSGGLGDKEKTGFDLSRTLPTGSPSDLEDTFPAINELSGLVLATEAQTDSMGNTIARKGVQVETAQFFFPRFEEGMSGSLFIEIDGGTLESFALLEDLLTGEKSNLELIAANRGSVFQRFELSDVSVVNFTTNFGESGVDQFQLSFSQVESTTIERSFDDGKLRSQSSTTIDYVKGEASASSAPGNSLGRRPGGITVDLGGGEFDVLSASSNYSGRGQASSSFQVTAVPGGFINEILSAYSSGSVLDDVEIVSSGLDPFAAGANRFLPDPSEIIETDKTELGSALVNHFTYSIVSGETPLVDFSFSAESAKRSTQIVIAENSQADASTEFDFGKQTLVEDANFTASRVSEEDRATVVIDVKTPDDTDGDLVGASIEAGAPNDGDGNQDGTPDNQQNNVASLPHPIAGNYVTLAAPEGQTLANVSIDAAPDPDTNPPADFDFRVGLADFEVRNVESGAATTVTIFIDSASGFNTFYKFGPTPSNPEPHYYRFLFDEATGTGAQFLEDRIVVHLIDGARGDDDMTANGIIVDPGAPVIHVTDLPHQNPLNRFDVNEDTRTSALDALVVINELGRSQGPRDLPTPELIEMLPFYDANGDNRVSALDALVVINAIGQEENQGEGELFSIQGSMPPSEFEFAPAESTATTLDLDNAPNQPTMMVADPEKVAIFSSPAMGHAQENETKTLESYRDNMDQVFEALGSQLSDDTDLLATFS